MSAVQIDELTQLLLKREKNKAKAFLEDIIEKTAHKDYAHALVSVILNETRKKLCNQNEDFFLDENELLDSLFPQDGQCDIGSIIDTLCEEVKNSDKENRKRTYLKAIAYIDENLFDCNLSVGNAARYAGVSPGGLSKLFEKYKGTTPLEYIKYRRVEKSMPKIKEKNPSVKDIAVSVGFSSAEGYIRAFKKQYSMPPGQWNKLFIAKNDR